MVRREGQRARGMPDVMPDEGCAKRKKGGYQTGVANVMKVPDDVIQRLCGPPRAPGLHGFRGALEGAMLQAVNSGFVAKGLNF